MIAAYVLGLPYGPKGVALAYSAAMVLCVVPLIAACIHGTTISPKDFLPVVGRPLLSALVGGMLAYAAQLLYGQSLPPVFRLILGCGILSLSYLWMLLYVMGQKAFYLELLQGLRGRATVSETESGKVLGG
jgi:PST family polysaccharide transporter